MNLNPFQAIILGLTQGLAEFLPISSSGHLLLVQKIFNLPSTGLLLEVLLHAGTLLAVLVVYFKLFWNMVRHPVRSLRTPFARNYAKAEYGGLDDEALEALGTGALRKAVVEGDLEEGCFLSGQVAAMVKQVQPAADIVREVMEGAEPVLKGATKWVK